MDKDPFLRSVFKIRFPGSVEKTDLCLYFFEYSPDGLKEKTKVLDILRTTNVLGKLI